MYEYKVIPAPAKGKKQRGIKGAEARFAHALESVMNELAQDRWEFQRADILPSEERQGITSTQTIYRSVLVFRRLADEVGTQIEQNDPPEEEMIEPSEDDLADDEMSEPEESAQEMEDSEAEKV